MGPNIMDVKNMVNKGLVKDGETKEEKGKTYDASCGACNTDFEVEEKDVGKLPFTTECPNCGKDVEVN